MKHNVVLNLGVVLVIILLITGCTAKKGNNSDSQLSLPSQTEVRANELDISKNVDTFTFGIEYAVPGLGNTYAETGVHAAKPTPALVIWGNIQKSKDSTYDWSDVDKHIKEYQEAGFDSLQLLITAESKWASKSANNLKVTDTRPKPEFEQDYIKFVKEAVERYDDDNNKDMPELKYPINEWGIEREFTGFFPGSGNEYVEVLKLAYPAIKEANPNAIVMLNALLMWDIFQGNPNDEEINKRLAAPAGGKRKDLTDADILLDATEYYDVVDFHSLGDYTEIPATVRWIRKEMAIRGVEKKIFIGDAFTMSPLLVYGIESCEKTLLSAKELFPVTPTTRCEAAELISQIRANKSEAKAWLEANIAIGLVRKYVVAAGEKVAGINIGNMEDWEVLAVGAGTTQYFGMIDRTVALGDQQKVKRIPGEKRAAFYALKMTIQNLDGFDSVTKLDFDNSTYVYEFTKNGKKIIVTWYDDSAFYGLGAKPPKKEVKIPWPEKTARITEIPILRGQTPIIREVTATENVLTAEIGHTPVFIT